MAWGLFGAAVVAAAGCHAPAQRARLAREKEELRTRNAALRREVEQRDERIRALTRQIDALQSFPSDRPVSAFAPVRIDIANRSGGRDFDGVPGDDGIVVHLRLYDADGDAVKSPGRVRIQATDNEEIGYPRVVAVCDYASVEELRSAWHGRFGTSHYTFRCPFNREGSGLSGPTVDVRVEFTDYLTGATLTTLKQLPVLPAATR